MDGVGRPLEDREGGRDSARPGSDVEECESLHLSSRRDVGTRRGPCGIQAWAASIESNGGQAGVAAAAQGAAEAATRG